MEDDLKRDILALSGKNRLNCRNELSGFHWPSIRISIWAKTHLQSQRLQFIILCAMPSTLVHNSAKNVLFVIFIWTSFVWFAKKSHSYCNVRFVRSFDVYYIIWCRVINPNAKKPFWLVLSLTAVVNFPANIQKLFWFDLSVFFYDDVNKAYIVYEKSTNLSLHRTSIEKCTDRPNNKGFTNASYYVMTKKNDEQKIIIKCMKKA